jgi:uncharacterized protein YdiU (UPF0061 family)
VFNQNYQPWTGGGLHFSFFNQPMAAERNFHVFCMALIPLLTSHEDCLRQLEEIRTDFSTVMRAEMEKMWAAKLGLGSFDAALFTELETLMVQTPVDYIILFRELSTVPDDIGPLKKSFYSDSDHEMASTYETDTDVMDKRWSDWLIKWKSLVGKPTDPNSTADISLEAVSREMKLVNPKYSLREWFVVPAYQQAAAGDYSAIRELQAVMAQPYAEQSQAVEDKYYRLKPAEFFEVGGLSHYSCSS